MNDKRFTLRIDEKLFNEIENCAKQNRRSTGKEIETAIEMYIRAMPKEKEGEQK